MQAGQPVTRATTARPNTSLGLWLSVVSAVAVLGAALRLWPIQVSITCVILGMVFSHGWESPEGSKPHETLSRWTALRLLAVNFVIGAAAGCVLGGMACGAIYYFDIVLPFSWHAILQAAAGLGAAITSVFPTAAACVRTVFFLLSMFVPAGAGGR